MIQNGNLTPASGAEEIQLSVMVPIYNEEENIPLLEAELFPVLEGLGISFEVIAVNDGSGDNSLSILQEIARRRPQFKVVSFRRNYGQTAAMMAGIDYARGDILVSLDADLQNDPTDIPRLLAKLGEGFDVVSGWRKDRQDAAIRRNFVSRMANKLISRISGIDLHDYGCTLKAYRHDVIKGVNLYGEMHRFIPIYASWQGARVTELPVQHHPRRFGKSKYGLERIMKVMLDLLVVKFLEKNFVKPIYVFGGFGIFSVLLSFLSFLWAVGLKLFNEVPFISTPLPLLAAVSFLLGVMCILMGLLAEMIVRTYFESQQRRAYLVKEVINIREPG